MDIQQGSRHMTKEEATTFFSWFYGGEHHIPSEVKAFGDGFFVRHDRGSLDSYDFNSLTKLVLMAHEKAYRVSVMPHTANSMKIAIWKRSHEGKKMFDRHPTIEQAINDFNQTKDNYGK